MGDVEAAQLAKKIHIYSNGDRFFTGRRFVINPRQTRNYESLLSQVTLSLKPAFGAVRVLRTPENGHPVNDLQDLETGRSYVACAQKFVKLGYEEISLSKPKPAPSPERRNRVVVSGRIRKIDRTPITIFVYSNGEPLEQARRILLKPWVQKTWETVLAAISEKVHLRNGAIRHIMDYNTKQEVTQGIHLKHSEYYVAIGAEKYKNLDYGTIPVILAPKQQQKRQYPKLQPIKKKGDESTGSSRLDGSSNTSDNSLKAPNKKVRKQPQPAEEEGIPIKPIKHKRGSGNDKQKNEKREEPVAEKPRNNKPARKPADNPPQKKAEPVRREPEPKAVAPKPKPVDLDNDYTPRSIDEGGVYKSKVKREKAKQVPDDKKVQTEVPIDKRKAQTVKEEQPVKSLPPPKTSKTQPKKVPNQDINVRRAKLNKTYSAEQEKAAIQIQAQYRGYRVRKSMKNNPAKERTTKSVQPKYRGRAVKNNPNKNGADPLRKYTEKETKAAIKIQAQYRGYKVRKDMKESKEAPSATIQYYQPDNTAEQERAATKIQAQYRGYKVRKEMKESKEPQSATIQYYRPDNTAEQERAATKIQAQYRGYKVRKEIKDKNRRQKAAVTIQANYRGYKVRKGLKTDDGKEASDKPTEEG